MAAQPDESRRRTAAEARAGFRRLGDRRRRLKRQLDEVDAEIADWAIETKGVVPREEAAELVGITRAFLQKLIAWRQGKQASRH